MRRVKAIAYDDEVSLVEHLDELRARVVVSIAVFGVALALCFW
jgi:Sec-independent protein secretion pathway component TatC